MSHRGRKSGRHPAVSGRAPSGIGGTATHGPGGPPSSRSNPPVIDPPESTMSTGRSGRGVPAATPGPGGRLFRALSWLDSRTGYRAVLHHALSEPVRGGASFAYVFGSLLTFLLVNQMLTGALLAAFYAPSATDAWASVAYIQDQVWLGWFIRGMHSAGASCMVVVLLLHVLQVTVYGAYRAPREMNWLTGLLTGALVFGFALTGYLLPWDQKGYWATQVVTTLLSATPLVGPTLQTLIQGGPTYGNLTLTHFFALHVFALPAVVLLLTAIHIAVFRRHGVTPRWGRTEADLLEKTEPFWPRQLTYDLTAIALLLLWMVGWNLFTHGADLSAPADPSSAYDARPEWYFLPLYQLLKYFPGPLEVVAALGVPLLAGSVLCALPFRDRAPTTDPQRRRAPIAVVLGGMGLLAVLGTLAKIEDKRNPAFVKNQAAAAERAEVALKLARKGVPPAGGVAVFLNDPIEGGRALFVEHCAGCHPLGAMRPAEEDIKGPDLTHYGSRGWLDGFLRDPNGPSYFGRTPIHGMKAVQLPDAEMKALVEYIYSLGGDKNVDLKRVASGRKLFTEKQCDYCHEVDGKTEGEGPNLHDHGSPFWVRALLVDPASPLHFGDKNDMPAFARKLGDEELDQLSAFVTAQRDR